MMSTDHGMMSAAKKRLPPLTRKTFEQAAKASGTDKGVVHGYQRFYPLVLSQLSRREPFTIVEIGYGNGASIPMWQSLFPNAFLVCIDKDVAQSGDGYVVIQADQSDTRSIMAAMAEIEGPVRLIIDDGSHHPQHQLSSFSILFESLLEPGGHYIIEDIETSYWLAGNLYGNEMRYGLFSRWSAMEALKLAADYVNRTFLSPEDRSLVEYSMMMAGLSPSSAEAISFVAFGQNCALLKKMEPGDQAYVDRDYGYSIFTRRA